MRVVGIDLSLTGTAYAVADSYSTVDGIETERITTSKTGPERLVIIASKLAAVVAGGDRADLVVLEGYSYASPQGSHQIGELGGLVRVLLWQNDLPYVTTTPNNRAKFATGSGAANKDAVVSAVSGRTGRIFRNNDEVDAYILACSGMAAYGYLTPLAPTNAAHRESLEAVEWPHLDGHAPVVEYKPKPKKTKKKAA